MSKGDYMKNDVQEIINKLEHAQNLLYQDRKDEAKTAVYEAQQMAIFLRDHGLAS